MNKIKVYIKSILVPVIIGAIIGFITSSSIDYNNLQRPPLAPPGYLFPIIWTILFVLMGISYGILKNKNLVDERINSIYYLQLAVNALWSIFFFAFKWRLFSFIWIILLDVLIVIMIIRFFNKNKLAGLLQIPYLLWVLFASYLNLAIYFLN
ncbi:MAG: tryptophan-rich sensory protein [Clostridia bacterium]|nr:tryptophan-rich sensory protein [Clostridia bacterium]